MTERELDAEIAKRMYKWDYAYVGPDYHGKNDGFFLFQSWKEISQQDYNMIPNTGAPHEALFVQEHSRDINSAIRFARACNYDIAISELPNTPMELVKSAFEHWKLKNPDRMEPRELRQEMFNNLPANIDWIGVDFDGLLSFGTALNPRFTYGSERWHGFTIVGTPVKNSPYRPLTSIKRII